MWYPAFGVTVNDCEESYCTPTAPDGVMVPPADADAVIVYTAVVLPMAKSPKAVSPVAWVEVSVLVPIVAPFQPEEYRFNSNALVTVDGSRSAALKPNVAE